MTAKYRPPSMLALLKFDEIHCGIRKELESLMPKVVANVVLEQTIILSREISKLNQIIHNKHSLKDVLVIVKLLGELPYTLLSFEDFACIARFVTRTSLEKQMGVFESSDIVGICVSLLLFLKYEGMGCREGGSGRSVIHEVLRSVAQLILLSTHAMGAYRLDSIQFFSHYAHNSSPDSPNLVPALDGLCNLLNTHIDASSQPTKELPIINAVSVFEINDNYDSVQLLEKSVEKALLFNLRNAQVKFHDSSDCAQRCRWLVSGMRALTAALTLAITTQQRDQRHNTSSTATSTPVKGLKENTITCGFMISSSSIVNALNISTQIFDNILRKVDIKSEVELQSNCPLDVRIKVWRHAICFLSALAVYNSAVDMKKWEGQLGDSIVVEAKWRALCAISSVNSAQTKRSVEFRSQLFKCVTASEHISLRVAATECLHSMLDRPSLRRDVVLAMRLDKSVGGATHSSGSESNCSLILKVFKVVAMALRVERSEEVVKELLRIATLFVTHMPLLSVTVDIQDEEGKVGLAMNGIQQDLETIGLVIFRGVMAVAAERQTPSPGANLAILWLEQFCKMSVSSHAFLAALLMPFVVERSVVKSGDVKHIDHSPIKTSGRSTAATEGSWRKGATPSVSSIDLKDCVISTPQINEIVPALQSPQSNTNINTFLSAVVDICSACSRGVSGTSNAQGVVVRSLCSLLVSGYPALLRSDRVQWMGSVLDSYAMSEAPALRVQSCRMVTAILNSTIDSYSAAIIVFKFDEAILATRSLRRTLEALFHACVDAEHQVRAAANGSFGAFPSAVWDVLKELPIELLQLHYETDGIQSVSIQVAIVRTLLRASGDAVSTVRSAAFKALGDMVLSKGLTTSSDFHTLSDIDSELIGSIFAAASAAKCGFGDSSLAVRTQAAWVISNLLQAVLPLRFDLLKHHDQSVSGLAIWLSDSAWRSVFEMSIHMLTSDSDKLSATAVRTLGILTGGLSPHHHSHQELIDQYYNILCEKYLNGDVSLAVQLLENQSQKLAFAVCQSLGFVLWGELSQTETSPANQSRVGEIVDIQVAMLRCGKPALQLQAAQILLFVMSNFGEHEHCVPSDSVHRILETVLLIATVPRRAQHSSKLKKTQTDLALVDPSVDEANRLLESRISSLTRYLLILLWSVLRLSTVTHRAHSQGSAFRRGVLSQLDDKSKGFVEWLERQRMLMNVNTASVCHLESQIVLGLPHTSYSSRRILLTPLDGKLYSVIVSETAGGVLDLLQLVEQNADLLVFTEHLMTTCVSRLEALRDGFARPSSSSSTTQQSSGSYGLFSGLEPILSPRINRNKDEEDDSEM